MLKDYFDIIESNIDTNKPISKDNKYIGMTIIHLFIQKRLMTYEKYKKRVEKWIKKKRMKY